MTAPVTFHCKFAPHIPPAPKEIEAGVIRPVEGLESLKSLAAEMVTPVTATLVGIGKRKCPEIAPVVAADAVINKGSFAAATRKAGKYLEHCSRSNSIGRFSNVVAEAPASS